MYIDVYTDTSMLISQLKSIVFVDNFKKLKLMFTVKVSLVYDSECCFKYTRCHSNFKYFGRCTAQAMELMKDFLDRLSRHKSASNHTRFCTIEIFIMTEISKHFPLKENACSCKGPLAQS